MRPFNFCKHTSGSEYISIWVQTHHVSDQVILQWTFIQNILADVCKSNPTVFHELQLTKLAYSALTPWRYLSKVETSDLCKIFKSIWTSLFLLNKFITKTCITNNKSEWHTFKAAVAPIPMSTTFGLTHRLWSVTSSLTSFDTETRRMSCWRKCRRRLWENI